MNDGETLDFSKLSMIDKSFYKDKIAGDSELSVFLSVKVSEKKSKSIIKGILKAAIGGALGAVSGGIGITILVASGGFISNKLLSDKNKKDKIKILATGNVPINEKIRSGMKVSSIKIN